MNNSFSENSFFMDTRDDPVIEVEAHNYQDDNGKDMLNVHMQFEPKGCPFVLSVSIPVKSFKELVTKGKMFSKSENPVHLEKH